MIFSKIIKHSLIAAVVLMSCSKANETVKQEVVTEAPVVTVATKGYSVILGRPTNVAVTVSILFDQVSEVYWEYGTTSGNYMQKTTTSLIRSLNP